MDGGSIDIKQAKLQRLKELFPELFAENQLDWMSDKQKKIKINNLLSELRRKNRIRNDGSDAKPKWVLIDI